MKWVEEVWFAVLDSSNGYAVGSIEVIPDSHVLDPHHRERSDGRDGNRAPQPLTAAEPLPSRGMGLKDRLQRALQTNMSGVPGATAAASAPTAVDPNLPDDRWLATSERAYRDSVDGYYGSPETMGKGGQEHYGNAEFGVALFFYAKSIDMLHTAYGYARMEKRQPSPADAWIVEGFCNALEAALEQHPNAPVAEVAGMVTHRLRDIAADCDRVGAASQLYRHAEESVGRCAASAES